MLVEDNRALFCMYLAAKLLRFHSFRHNLRMHGIFKTFTLQSLQCLIKIERDLIMPTLEVCVGSN